MQTIPKKRQEKTARQWLAPLSHFKKEGGRVFLNCCRADCCAKRAGAAGRVHFSSNFGASGVPEQRKVVDQLWLADPQHSHNQKKRKAPKTDPEMTVAHTEGLALADVENGHNMVNLSEGEKKEWSKALCENEVELTKGKAPALRGARFLSDQRLTKTNGAINLFLRPGFLLAQRQKTMAKITNAFGFNGQEKRRLRTFLENVRNQFKFMDESVINTHYLVSHALDSIGLQLRAEMSWKERMRLQKKRSQYHFAVYKLLGLAVGEERCSITKSVKRAIESKFPTTAKLCFAETPPAKSGVCDKETTNTCAMWDPQPMWSLPSRLMTITLGS